MSGTDPPSLAQKTVIAYFDPLNVYGELKKGFDENLPLVNLHWNHPLRPLRSIAVLDVDLVEESAQVSAIPKHQMLGLSSAPYLKIVFFKCDDTDTYRSSVRPVIREWLANNVNATRDPTEWLVVHYIPSGSKVFLGNRFKYGVFDKAKIDFNTGFKKDRCIQLRDDYLTNAERIEAWKEFMARIKEGVLEAFSSRVDLYQEEINKLEAKKHILGWNYGKFFVMKEGLALSFEKMNLFEDALLLYDELEEAFIQMSRQKSVTFFSSVGFENIPSPLLEIQKDSQKRHDILSNEISLFDFHCYLFSRQAFLLLCIAKASSSPSIAALKVGELFLRLRSFLTEMNALLGSNQKSLQAAAEWTFNVAQEFRLATTWIDGGLVREVSEGRGELFLLGRKSLETIAATRNWFIEGVLTEVSLDDLNPDIIEPDYKIENEILALSLESKERFYGEYKKITECALGEFDLADRVRSKNRLSAQLALLDFQLGNYEEAAKLLESIPGLYNRQGWTLISTSLLTAYVQCLKKLNRPEDILINSLELLSRSKHLSCDEISEHIATIQKLSETVSYMASLDSYFDVTVDPQVKCMEGSDIYFLQVFLRNTLKHDFLFDSATLTMRNLNDSTDILSFEVSKKNQIIAGSGQTCFNFETQKFVQAKFKITAIFFTRGQLAFTKSFTESTPIVIQLHPSPLNFHAKLCIPAVLNLSERRVGLLLRSGQNSIKSGKITFKSVSKGLKPISMKAKSETEGIIVNVLEGKPPIIVFDSLSPSSSFMVSVPYVIEYDVMHIRLKAYIEYTTSDEMKFSYVIDQTLEISLALSVNVQDFYKWDKLFSKFTMSCNNQEEPVRIISTQLASTEDFDIASPYGTMTSHIAYPGGPVSYGFCIKHTEDRTGNDVVQLTTNHRYLRDECFTLVWKMVKGLLQGTEFEKYGLLIELLISKFQFDSISYSYSEVVKFPPTFLGSLAASDMLQYIPPHDKEAMFKYLGDNLMDDTSTVHLEEKDLVEVTHQLVIPVSIPQVHVVYTVELKLPSEDHFVVGKPIAASITIKGYQDWSPVGDNLITPDTKFIYDIAASESWAVSGKKKAYFQITGEEENISISLVPLRTGKLGVPKITIQMHEPSDTPSIAMEINYRNEYQSALVVPEFDRLTLSF